AEILIKANKFNKFFANVGRKTFEESRENLNIGLHNEINVELDYNRIVFKPEPVDLSTIILTIKELNDTNAFGSDNIPFKYIKDCLPTIVFYILIIVNTSITTSKFPKNWKYPHVLPYFKSGNKDEVSNYRPISLLPILSKVLEKIVAKQLVNYLESNQILSNHQHGFRSKLSTETALLTVTEKIYRNIDEKKLSLLLLLDLSKAFDSVSHDILLKKCIKYNIDPSWIASYLCDRYQAVRINNTISSPCLVPYGVPEGSILGPILFLIYVNDISDYIKNCLLVQYADDTQLLLTGSIEDIKELINQAEILLITLKKYFQMNGLKLNENKTQCIFFGSRQYVSRIPNDIIIRLGDSQIVPSTSVKNLGVYMDQYLTYDIHIKEI
ncbi:MAG: reverse transcriptase family protein, partial [Bacteroidota bacterium]